MVIWWLTMIITGLVDGKIDSLQSLVLTTNYKGVPMVSYGFLWVFLWFFYGYNYNNQATERFFQGGRFSHQAIQPRGQWLPLLHQVWFRFSCPMKTDREKTNPGAPWSHGVLVEGWPEVISSGLNTGGGFLQEGYRKNSWFIHKPLLIWDDLGVPLFSETTRYNLIMIDHTIIMIIIGHDDG